MDDEDDNNVQIDKYNDEEYKKEKESLNGVNNVLS